MSVSPLRRRPRRRARLGLAVAGLLIAGLAVSTACDGEGEGSTPEPTPTGTPTVTATSDVASPGPGGASEDGPPVLQAEADGETARLGLGAYTWPFGDETRTDDTQGIVTDAQVLTAGAGSEVVVSGLGENEPTEVTVSAFARPDAGSEEGANRIAWAPSGDPTALEAGADGGELTIELGDLEAGEYVVQVALQFEDGYVEYGFQLDVE